MNGYLIQLKRRKQPIDVWTLVDEELYYTLVDINWGLAEGNYVRGSVNKHQIFMHRFVTGCSAGDGLVVDHINHNPLDNTRQNLRVYAGDKQNLQNTSSAKGSSSKYRGVTWDKRNSKWVAAAMLDNKQFTLGRFVSELEAARCVSDWRKENMPFSVECDLN